MSYIINQNVQKVIILVNILYLLFLKDIQEELSNKQSKFANKLKNIYEGIKSTK